MFFHLQPELLPWMKLKGYNDSIIFQCVSNFKMVDDKHLITVIVP